MDPIFIDKLGADPEVFLVDQQGQPFSAEGLFGGTKEAPRPMTGLPEGFFIQEDNVAAEFNIPATSNPDEWARRLQKGLSYIRKGAKKHKLMPMLSPALDFPIHMVMTPHAQMLGCDPDFNAWTCEINPRPKAPVKMRTAAAHIHVSWEKPDEEQRWELVRALDLFLGVPSILVTEPNDRRKLYGRAGACRLKPYGVEYRVLDNFYMKSIPLSTEVATRVYTTADAITRSDLLRVEIAKHGDRIQNAINNHDKAEAAALLAYFGVEALRNG